MSVPKILVVGVCRNVSRTLNREVLRLHRLLHNKFDLSFYFVESDSDDATVTVLQELQNKLGSSFKFVSLGTLKEDIPNRIDRITFCRNEYVRYFNCVNDINFVMVVDLDQRNYLLTSRLVDELIDRKVDAVFCSQAFLYDVYSFVLRLGDSINVWRDLFRDARFQIDPLSVYRRVILSRMLRLRSKDVLPVVSYFGGVGLYRAEAFAIGGLYEARIDGEVCCEHIPFNKKIFDSGGVLLILGVCKNFWFNRHLIPKLLFVFGLDFILVRKLRNKAIKFDE